MTRKSPSWFATVLFFLYMVACYLGFAALSPRLRPQMASPHSMFWTFAAPWSFACIAVLALGFRLLPGLIMRLRARSSGR